LPEETLQCLLDFGSGKLLPRLVHWLGQLAIPIDRVPRMGSRQVSRYFHEEIRQQIA